jgi:hypothetical protein
MFEHLANTLPFIVFAHVIRLEVFDLVPFEHEFFLRIARFCDDFRLFFRYEPYKQNHTPLKRHVGSFRYDAYDIFFALSCCCFLPVL